jgi:hypothetical protein
MDIGTEIAVVCLDGDTYTGKLIDICIGIDKENLKRTCIIIEESENTQKTYGQVLIWCDDIKTVNPCREVEKNG